jgi:hypothetical protein
MIPRPMKPIIGFAIVFSFLLPIADLGNITLPLQFAATEITALPTMLTTNATRC